MFKTDSWLETTAAYPLLPFALCAYLISTKITGALLQTEFPSGIPDSDHMSIAQNLTSEIKNWNWKHQISQSPVKG